MKPAQITFSLSASKSLSIYCCLLSSDDYIYIYIYSVYDYIEDIWN